MFDYAFDVLFQKPVLAVEHHGFLRQGYEPFTKAIQDLSSLPGRLNWQTLGKTVATSCLYRHTGEGEGALRHYTPTVHFSNPTGKDLHLSVEKPETEDVIEEVLNGHESLPFDVRSGFLRYSVHLRPSEATTIAVRYRQTMRSFRSVSLKYRLAASARRRLSEARDNYLARSERVLAVAEGIKSLVSREKSGGRAPR
jgi:hypothetical protein